MERQRKHADAAVEVARSEPFPPGTTIARYRLVSFIGSGAMGDVYRAHDRGLDREVALKVLPPELVGDRERVQRFAQEARSASALSHPHIVTIHEVGHARPVVSVQPIGARSPRAGEVHYISMELIEGTTLRETLASPPPLRRTIDLLAEVAEGLAKAHAAGIIHRDLKPDNILVSRDGYAKIVDFGLAKLIDTTWNPIGADSPTLRALTAHGELLGTPGYMAPEQVAGKTLDGRADIFSFGCILYEAIGGERAFEAESFVDTLYKIVHEDPAPLVDADPELERIVEKCLAKNPDERYQSIRDVASELREWSASATADSLPIRRRDARLLRSSLIAALVTTLAILGIVLLRRTTPPLHEREVRRVTTDGKAAHAAISPDGRYVAYVSSDGKGRTLWLEQIATGRTLAIAPPTHGHYAGVSFSRDGEYVYFTRYDDGPMGILRRVSILGGDAQELVRDIDSRSAQSPDGLHLAFARDDYNTGTTILIVANADGRNQRTIASLRLPDRIGMPVWAPDGARIAVVHGAKIVEVRYPDGETRTIEPSLHFQSLHGLAWPENSRLVVAATTNDGGHSRLWDLNPKSGAATPTTSELNHLATPTVSDSGATSALQIIRQANLYAVSTRGESQQLTSGIGAANGLTGVTWVGDRVIYASAADGKHDLWSLGAASRDAIRLTDDTAYEASPTALPNGSAILYLSGTAERRTIWRVNADGTQRRQLTNGPRDGDFAIAPDSKSIAWASVDPGTMESVLWSMPIGGGPKQRIASRATVLDQVRYSPDGKSIVFTGYDHNTLKLFRVPANGGPAKALLNERAHSAAFSPDGSTIACAYKSTDSMHTTLGLLPSRGGNPTTLALNGWLFKWLPNGRAVSFVREENGVMNLWLQPLDGGSPRGLTQFSEGAIVDYSWSADGKRAVVAHVIDSVDVVLMQ